MSILLSVIVPVYNTAKHLESCVSSILAQSVKSMEIILVDDGSTDSSPMICDKFSAYDDRIIVIHQENSGLSAARNAGLDICRGKFITFVDSDDIVLPDTYEKNINLLLNDDSIDVICFPYVYPYNKTNSLMGAKDYLRFNDKHEFILHHLDNKVNHAVWNKIFKRHIFERIKFPAGRFFEDSFILNELSCMELCYVCSGIGAYGYNLWENSIMSSAISPKKVIDRTIAYTRLLAEASKDKDIVKSKYYVEAYHYALLYLYNLKNTRVLDDGEFSEQYEIFNKLPLSLHSIFASKATWKEKMRLLCCKYFGVKKMIPVLLQ